MLILHSRIFQNILADVSQVDIQLTSRTIIVVDEWIHHPKLKVFDIGNFEIVIVNTSHHTPPTCFRSNQATICSYPSTERRATVFKLIIVRPSLLRIICQIQSEDLLLNGYIFIWKKFLLENRTHIMVT